MKILSRGRIFLVLIFLSVAHHGFSQSNSDVKKKTPLLNYGRPDIPGELGFDLGIVYAPDFPDVMKISLLRSLYFSPFYKYEFLIPKSKFSILTGLSVGCEKYRFKDMISIMNMPNEEAKFSDQVVRLDTILFNSTIKKSKLAVNYLEIPLELRFRSNKIYPRRSISLSVGGKIGILFNAHTKFKYFQNGDTKEQKHAESFDLNRFRYGVNARLGFGAFSFFYYYSLNTLFQKDKGPAGNISKPMNIGISLVLF